MYFLTLILASTNVMATMSSEEISLSIKPAAAGQQIVRVSLPMPQGFLPDDRNVVVSDGNKAIVAGLRALTYHPTQSPQMRTVRRALVTFPYEFVDLAAVHFVFRPVSEDNPDARFESRVEVELDAETEVITVSYRDGPSLRVRLVAPPRQTNEPPHLELTEVTPYFTWQRAHFPDSAWARRIEVRVDALGGVVIVAHLQRNAPGDGRAPDFGWKVTSAAASTSALVDDENKAVIGAVTRTHNFLKGEPCQFLFDDSRYKIYHPVAPLKLRGRVEVRENETHGFEYTYWRCLVTEKVPQQQAAWRRAEIVIAPANLAPVTTILEMPHEAIIAPRLWDELYDSGKPLDLANQSKLNEIVQYHYQAIPRSMALGDDMGNVTAYDDGRAAGPIHGMNRLNHCAPLFMEAYRSGDRRPVEAAVLWCENFYDQSIWWGPGETGGTRYNDAVKHGLEAFENDHSYMWRENKAYTFCTKGYDAFFLAYEQTGDPRMKEALDAQIRYAAGHLHANDGETRNIGDVRDFIRLYRFTGEQHYFDEALRLFRELRMKLSVNNLFSQHGEPILPQVPFIDDDETGYRFPFAKPYIIGYALAGLPELARYAPNEPKLREVIQATADFLAESQDPIGGWRYPHPRSSLVLCSSAMEPAWQLVQAGRFLGAQEKHLDAIEKALRLRIWGFLDSGRILHVLEGWEISTEKVDERAELNRFYKHPEDRSPVRDYLEGNIKLGHCPPDGLVYFPEVLAFYLEYRPAGRLLAPPAAGDPLHTVLMRLSSKATVR